ncbi:MAG: glycosyltransferase family 39 protein [Candidatus Omnitrophica bacterium]|nr:glycosyltransferase family 39 protein [Candidatus Omnitrophota bacterium]
MNLLLILRRKFEQVPVEIKYTFCLFLLTRIVFTLVGIFSRIEFDHLGLYNHTWVLNKHLWLDIWSISDSAWYLDIVAQGYPHKLTGHNALFYGFFPLYPLAIFIFNKLFGSPYITAIAISNICLILSCSFLYKLMRLDHDENTSLKSIKYLFLFPGTFILSGIFSESLFLLLLIMCFYYAKQRNWILTGTAGFFLALTRPNGILVLFPILVEYFNSKDQDLKKTSFDIFYLLLFIGGLLVFTLYCYIKTGNPTAYVWAKKVGWGTYPSNPFKMIINHLFNLNTGFTLTTIYSLTILLLLIVFRKVIGTSYFLLGLIFFWFPYIMAGDHHSNGIVRHLCYLFPAYVLFAKLGAKNEHLDKTLSVFLFILQIILFTIWCTNLKSMIV